MEFAGIFERLGEVINESGKLDLASQILDLQRYILRLEATVLERDKRISQLEAQLSIVPKVVKDGGDYFESDEKGAPTGGPLCSGCWESKRQAIHMVQMAGSSHMRGQMACPVCKSTTRWRPGK